MTDEETFTNEVVCVCFEKKIRGTKCKECGSTDHYSDHECPFCTELLVYRGEMQKGNTQISYPAFACEECERMMIYKDEQIMITKFDSNGKEINLNCVSCDKHTHIPEDFVWLVKDYTMKLDGYCVDCAITFLTKWNEERGAPAEVTSEDVFEWQETYNLVEQNRIMSDPVLAEKAMEETRKHLEKIGVNVQKLDKLQAMRLDDEEE